MAQQLQRDGRLVVMERTNLRHLTAADLGGPLPELVTLDLSFISVLTVLPAVAALMAPAAQLVSLIKPQFEARQEQVTEQTYEASPPCVNCARLKPGCAVGAVVTFLQASFSM